MMCNRTTHRFQRAIPAILFVFTLVGSLVWGEEPAEVSSEQLVAAASRIYEEQFREMEASEEITIRDVERLAEWSRKIVTYRTVMSDQWRTFQHMTQGIVSDAGNLGHEWNRALREHLERADAVQQLVRLRHGEDEADGAAVSAAEFFHLEARKLQAVLAATHAAVKDRLQLVIPEDRPEVSLEKPVEIFIAIDRQGALSVGERQLSPKDLETHLRRKHATHDNLKLIIRAHPESRFDRASEIIEMANQIGIGDVTLMTVTE